MKNQKPETNDYEKKTNSIYNKVLKRIIDLSLASFLILLIFPLIIIIAILQIIFNGFPIFYLPIRGGYKNKDFRIIKFRSMIKDADKIGEGTTAFNDKRITKFGHFLRKTKLDEIPQIFNVLFGQMSFVGPRPELTKYTNKYDKYEKYILYVRPGITDYSSLKYINLDLVVGGSNAEKNYEENVLNNKNQLRLKYVSNQSLINDSIIFIKTVIKVIEKIFKSLRYKNGKD